MRTDRIVLSLALTLACAGAPPAPAEAPEPVYSCGARADTCGDRILDALAAGTFSDPLTDNPKAPSATAFTTRVVKAVDDAYGNELRTNGGSALTEAEYYALYRRYLLSGGERQFVLAAIAAAHRPLSEAFEQGKCWHWFMDHGGRADGKIAAGGSPAAKTAAK